MPTSRVKGTVRVTTIAPLAARLGRCGRPATPQCGRVPSDAAVARGAAEIMTLGVQRSALPQAIDGAVRMARGLAVWIAILFLVPVLRGQSCGQWSAIGGL